MNDSFQALDLEKQARIIGAALKVFSQTPYAKASTDDIAALAGISKGLLFYHFKNKTELYLFLYQYSCKKVIGKVNEHHALDEPDFFERHIKIAEARVSAMQQFPYILDFMLRAYYETNPAVAQKIRNVNEQILLDSYAKLNQGLDLSKFKSKKDVSRADKMILWVGEGIIKEKRMAETLDLSQIQSEIRDYIAIIRRGFYNR